MSSHRISSSLARPAAAIVRFLVAAMLGLTCLAARAGGGPLGIDHEWGLDQRGIWGRNYQLGLEYGVVAIELGGALWLGNDNELGHTFWQTVDATAISAVAAHGLQYAFRRDRPTSGKGPIGFRVAATAFRAVR